MQSWRQLQLTIMTAVHTDFASSHDYGPGNVTGPRLQVHPLCELGQVGPAGSGELGRGAHSEGGMRPVVAVLLAPVGDKDLGFEQGVELLDGQQLVAHAGAIGLHPGVLPGGAGVDVTGARAGEPAPVAQGVPGELGPDVAADELGEPTLCGDLVQNRDGGVGIDGVGDQVGQGLAGVLVHHVQDLEGAPGGGDAGLVVQRSHVADPFGAEPGSWRGGVPEPLALAPPGWHAQAFLTPQPLDLLAVHLMALASEHRMRPPVTPPRAAPGEGPQRGAQIRIRIGRRRAVALHRPVLAHDAARPPLRQAKPGLEHLHGQAPPRRAHQFPGGRRA
jgi:hypothetical protein